jgi:ribosome-binding factor A
VSGRRIERLGREISKGVAEILQQEISDPRLGFVSVVGSKVSPDLKHARVFVSVMGDDKKKKLTMKGLKHAAGYIRRGLADRLCIRECPEIVFSLDDSIDKAFRISKLLDEVSSGGNGEEE